jgi:uncharacterized protein YcbK (DUF882 family)
MITILDYLMGREVEYPVTPEMLKDAEDLVSKVNRVLHEFGEDRAVSSGYRPAAINATIKNAAKKSNHMVCRACDLHDPDGRLDDFCVSNLQLLEDIGLWLESGTSTPGWCHLQIVPPKSNNRIFLP